MILKIWKQIIFSVLKRKWIKKMKKYANFVIYLTVQNVKINKEHFLRKEAFIKVCQIIGKKNDIEYQNFYGDICKVCDRKFYL